VPASDRVGGYGGMLTIPHLFDTGRIRWGGKPMHGRVATGIRGQARQVHNAPTPLAAMRSDIAIR
jgi:hypothetical protein